MRKRLVAFVILMGILSIAAIACSSATPPTPAPQQPNSPPAPPAAQAPVAPSQSQPTQSGGSSSGGVEFEVALQDPNGSGEYLFSPSDLTFNVGDTIEFKLAAETEFHTFTVDELDLDAEVEAGETVSVSYTFAEAGEFALICIPHEFLGMTGIITVQ